MKPQHQYVSGPIETSRTVDGDSITSDIGFSKERKDLSSELFGCHLSVIFYWGVTNLPEHLTIPVEYVDVVCIEFIGAQQTTNAGDVSLRN
jgi:hypothetical protein